MSNHRPDLFTHLINTMDFGVTAEELSNELAEVLQAVKDTSKQGTITLKLTVKPESVGAAQVSITPDITSKQPQMPRDKAMLFMTPDNNLEREDPRQKKLEFSAVGSSKETPMASADQATEAQFSQAQ